MSVIQPKRNTITYGIRSLAYIGAKLWNDMKFDFDNFEEMELCTFKQMLMNWKGPDSNSSYSYVQNVIDHHRRASPAASGD